MRWTDSRHHERRAERSFAGRNVKRLNAIAVSPMANQSPMRPRAGPRPASENTAPSTSNTATGHDGVPAIQRALTMSWKSSHAQATVRLTVDSMIMRRRFGILYFWARPAPPA